MIPSARYNKVLAELQQLDEQEYQIEEADLEFRITITNNLIRDHDAPANPSSRYKTVGTDLREMSSEEYPLELADLKLRLAVLDEIPDAAAWTLY